MSKTATTPLEAGSSETGIDRFHDTTPTSVEDVVVVGAGPAGLAAAGALGARGITGLVLDATPDVASSWRGRYDRLRLNTPRWLTHLPGPRLPRRLGRWPTREDYIAYLDAYARDRVPRRRHGVRVQQVGRQPDGWRLRTSAGDLRARNVVVATGYDRMPWMPDWPGRERFTWQLLHSAQYRNPEPFRGRDVLVVGGGTSGNEIAVQLLEGGASRVRVSIRTRPWVVPRQWLGVPVPALAYPRPRLPAPLLDRGVRLLDRLIWGDLRSVGLGPADEGATSLLRRTGHGIATDSGMFAAARAGRIEVLPAVTGFDGDAVVLADGRRIHPEVVIAATGYRCGLEELLAEVPGVLQPDGRPAVQGAEQAAAAPGLFTIGYRLPLSGQLPELRRDARAIARAVERRLAAAGPAEAATARGMGRSGGGRGPEGSEARQDGRRRITSVSRVADLYARLSPRLAARPGSALTTRAHAWLVRRSGGRLGGRFLGAPVVVLRTVGRRSGQPRQSPVFFLRHGNGFAVVASNAASPNPPAWWLNLQANPEAEAFVDGVWHPVRARPATPEEAAELWPRFVAMYRGYDHYKAIATRELPVVVLEPR